MVSRVLTVVGVAGLIVGTAVPAHADIYRCKRADGTQHYTNIREPGRRCQLVVRSSKKSKPKASAKKKGSGTKSTSGSRSTRDPARYSRYNSLIGEAARLYQLPESFIRAVMRVESDFNPQW